ncbi:hypothetical protein KKF34_12615 [Myxococcota bacterium]|nr:hypothetical protein [Myxococcota bacterium]MBU1382685.1 hypothetical protein [Myxococcota bacterium]MBU1497708.1 hypothetical protein [Myxococcota bacterium]
MTQEIDNDIIDSPREQEIPIIQPPVLFKETQAVIRQLSSMLDGKFIAYWNSPGGNVCGNDTVAIYEMLEKIGNQDRVYLFLKSMGGDGKSSLRIVNLLRRYVKEIIALVPLQCASAATMIALGANEIQMGPMAYLSPVDTSLVHDLSPLDRDNMRVSISLDELKRVIRLWQGQKSNDNTNPYESLFTYVHPLVIGAVDRADSLSVMLCREILSYHIKEQEKCENISNILNSKYPAHSYPILMDEARRIGLNATEIDPKVHEKLLELNEIYSEMGQRAITDFSDIKYHDNEILNIIETNDQQLYYQVDKDWYYRVEERRWIYLNDASCWRKVEMHRGKMRKSRVHLS